MELDDALVELPPTYAQALRLRRDGATELDISAHLDIPPDSVATLVQLAEAKLAALLVQPDPTRCTGSTSGETES